MANTNESDAIKRVLFEGLRAKGQSVPDAIAKADAVLSLALTEAHNRLAAKMVTIRALKASSENTPEVLRAKNDPRVGIGSAWFEVLGEIRGMADTFQPV